MRTQQEIKNKIIQYGVLLQDSLFEADGFIGLKGSILWRHGPLGIMVSNGKGWEHVSVSTLKRCPVWEEMCFVKDFFWGAAETVMQLHPPESDYINNHPYCLHLWRPMDGVQIPLPPSWMVGLKTQRAQVVG